MKRAGHDAMLVLSGVNIRYLCGFKGTFGLLLVVPRRNRLLTDQRYALKAERTVRGVEVVQITGQERFRRVKELLKEFDIDHCAFEPGGLTHEEYRILRKDTRGIRLSDGDRLVEKLRLCKDAVEVAAVRKACRITDRGFKFLLETVRPGMSERELRAELERELLTFGVDGFAFETIVASGPNAAQPHTDAGKRRVRGGEFVLFDFGVCVGGYHSDMTRTIFVGKPTTGQRRLYGAVLEAQRVACARAGPGAPVAKVEAAARDVLKRYDLERHFNHGLGHGVGLEVHEEPRVSAAVKARLRKGMVITIEPGVYLRNRAGIRIEDTGVVTADGFEPLTRSSKKLICV